jgi:hypothetical protein
MRRKRLARLLRKLRAMRRSLPSLVQLLMRLGAAKAAAGRAFQFVQMQVPEEGFLISANFSNTAVGVNPGACSNRRCFR